MRFQKMIASATVLAMIGGMAAVCPLTVKDFSLTVSAEVDDDGNEYTDGMSGDLMYRKYADHAAIVYCDYDAAEVHIPDEIDGVPVTEIWDSVFSYHDSLTVITIPDSVTSIGAYAFDGTPWLENKQKENPLVIVNHILVDATTCDGDVVIPDGVIRINPLAFSGCKSLTSVVIPDSVTSIGDWAFMGCLSLESITIPDSVTSIGGLVFGELFEPIPWLENKRQENPLVIVNNILIDGMTCTGDVVIPDGVKEICHYAFYECEDVTSVTIPDSVTAIGTEAFFDCTALTEITIPYGVTKIYTWCFSGCESLREITIPNSVEFIDYGAFSHCAMTEITLPESVAKIDTNVFESCPNLAVLTILNPDCEIPEYPGTVIVFNGIDENYEPYYNGVICGYTNSTAQAYAENNGFRFEALDAARGDVDGDGAVQVKDALLALQGAAAITSHMQPDLTETQIARADVDNDGALTIRDAQYILRYYSDSVTGLNPDWETITGVSAE